MFSTTRRLLFRSLRGLRPGHASRCEYGALAVEYGLCIVIAGVMMIGVQELFWEMAQNILDNFMNWISKPYP
jgi:Flp pilus assembly pilin Flp